MFLGPVQLLELTAQQISGELSIPTLPAAGLEARAAPAPGAQAQKWSHEAPGRCAQHLSKGAASSPLVGRMGLGGISGEL